MCFFVIRGCLGWTGVRSSVTEDTQRKRSESIYDGIRSGHQSYGTHKGSSDAFSQRYICKASREAEAPTWVLFLIEGDPSFEGSEIFDGREETSTTIIFHPLSKLQFTFMLV